MTRRLLFLLVLFLFAVSRLATAQETIPAEFRSVGVVKVKITGLRNANGNLHIALFDAKKGFPGKFDKAVQTTTLPATVSEPVAVFDNVLWGRYAVAVRHDENGNGKLDANFLGMPKEGVGTSNNPRTSFGPPSFDDAAFMLEQKNMELSVKLKYL